jgi:hypothetical protein
VAVVAADLLYQGEFLADGKPLARSRRVENNNREFAGYTLGYNHPLFAQRVHDLLTLISFVKHHEQQPERILLIGMRGAAAHAAAAAAIAGDAIHKVALDTGGFRFAAITDIRDVNLWPGAVKYGDLPAVLALIAPRPLRLTGESGVPDLAEAAYRAAGAANVAHDNDSSPEKTADWLLR